MPKAWLPAAGALAAVAVALALGFARLADLALAARELWRPLVTITGIMATTSAAAELGVFARIAVWIEPRTRGPVRHAYRLVFAIAAITAALVSNDAAILLVTPVVIALLRQVYPRRNPKFLVPFAFAVFVAAGVAPLPTGNPMNLVVATRANIGFVAYVAHMLPVAIAGWIVSYAVLAWWFRAALSDEAPALGAAPVVPPLTGRARAVLVLAAASIAAYPVLAELGAPLWTISAPVALASTALARSAGTPLRRIAAGVSWELVPFLFGVFVLALALAHAGSTDALAHLYATSPCPLPTVGAVAAAGSALANNHPMALLHSLALANAPHRLVYAALVGGDLGPRLLPHGSLAGLLWLHALRRSGVDVSLATFVKLGVAITIPTLAVSLATLWLT